MVEVNRQLEAPVAGRVFDAQDRVALNARVRLVLLIDFDPKRAAHLHVQRGTGAYGLVGSPAVARRTEVACTRVEEEHAGPRPGVGDGQGVPGGHRRAIKGAAEMKEAIDIR